MERTIIKDIVNKIGQEVKLNGWVATRRDHGKLVFVDLRDRSGIIQVVGGDQLGDLKSEDVVEITGLVKERPASMVNEKIATGKVEIGLKEVKVLAKAEDLPFDTGSDDLNVSLPILLDYRSLSLRHLKKKAVF